MKRRADYIVLLVGLFLLAFSLPGHAQEKSFPIIEEVSESEHDGAAEDGLPTEEISRPSVFRDSVIVKPTGYKTKDKSEKQSSEGEEALSFNFLYYIIQRFKMSDIMDE